MKTSKPFSIFLVDDDELFVTSLKEQVKKMFKNEINIQTFGTGEDCLKNFNPPPNIIVLDYFLNGKYPEAIDGLQVLKKITQISPETKVIMLSAQEKIEIAVNLIKYGAYDYIIKNDNVYLRTKLVIKNAANAISVSRELKKAKLMVRIAGGVLLGIFIACTVIQLFYPSLFRMGTK